MQYPPTIVLDSPWYLGFHRFMWCHHIHITRVLHDCILMTSRIFYPILMTSHYFWSPKYQVESSIFIYYIASGLCFLMLRIWKYLVKNFTLKVAWFQSMTALPKPETWILIQHSLRYVWDDNINIHFKLIFWVTAYFMTYNYILLKCIKGQ